MRGFGGVRRRNRLAVLTSLAALALSICAAVPTAAQPTRASQTATASITGTITDASTGQPPSAAFQAFVGVQAFDTATGQSAATALADANGAYTLGPLSPGTYTLEFGGQRYVPQWWNNKPSAATADTVTVASGQVVTGIDAALVPFPDAISGTATDNTGQPIAGATVQVADCNNNVLASGTTAADGTYTVTALPPTTSQPLSCGDIVRFGAPGYSAQWVCDVPVASGQTTSGIDAVLQPVSRAMLCGMVVDYRGLTNQTPLAGATVVVHNYYGFTVAQTTTGADGNWSVGNLGGGVYRVEFQPPAGSGLLGQWWSNEPDEAHSNGVGVAPGTLSVAVNADLTSGSTIQGSVTDPSGPVAGASVGIFTTNSSNAPPTEVAHTTTLADGTYNVPGLQAGNYDVLFDPPAGSADVGQWYNNSPTAGGATAVALSSLGSTTADAQLTAGARGSISGTVTDTSGNPIAGSTVLAVAADGRTGTTATTAADGSYTVANLDVGIDTVWFLPPAGSSYGASVWNATVGKILPVIVDQGSAITGINATLASSG